MVLLLLTHEPAVPFFGFSQPWSEIPLKGHLSEIFTHAIFGVSAEMARRLVRPLLGKLPGMARRSSSPESRNLLCRPSRA